MDKIARIRAEIERRFEKYDEHYTSAGKELNDLLFFIKKLMKQKEPDKSLEEAADEWAENETYGKSDAEFEMAYKGFITGAEWQKEQDERVYREFFNERNQGDASFRDLLAYKEGHRDGMEEQKDQMMKDAVKGKVNQDGFLELSNGEVIDICPTLKRCALGLHIGDKVRIIIMKEEEQI